MERCAFLVESSGDRIECLLNPETMTIVREAGVRPQRTLSGVLSGVARADDPLLAVGGGTTQVHLDLLFDVSKQPDAQPDDSVQTLTAPLWNLAENGDDGPGQGIPPRVRFVWGKAWNILGVVVAVAQRFEQFSASGNPRRSWVRMRLLRQDEDSAEKTPAAAADGDVVLPSLDEIRPESLRAHEIQGGGAGADDGGDGPGQIDRIDYLAYKYYGDPSMWRALASFNGIDDPTQLTAGTPLLLPPLDARAG